MSHKVACFAPDAPRQHLLEAALKVLGLENLSGENLALAYEEASLVLIWDKNPPETQEKRRKTIFLAGNQPAQDKQDYFCVLEAPFRLGAVIDQIRRFFKSGPAFNVPAEIKLEKAVFKPAESLFYPENTENPVNLTEKERDILLALYHAKNLGLSRDELLNKVWAYVQGVETHTLETHIYRLRRKIEADPAEPELLINQDGQYKLSCF